MIVLEVVLQVLEVVLLEVVLQQTNDSTGCCIAGSAD